MKRRKVFEGFNHDDLIDFKGLLVNMEMNKFDKGLEFIVLGGFFGMILALMQFVVPEANSQHFSQALGAWIVIATLVAKSLWERNSTDAKLTEQRVENVAKSYDAIRAATDTVPLNIHNAATEKADGKSISSSVG